MAAQGRAASICSWNVGKYLRAVLITEKSNVKFITNYSKHPGVEMSEVPDRTTV